MPDPLALSALQSAFAAHVLGRPDRRGALASELAPAPGWGAEERLSVHRNTTLITLSEALSALYPVVLRLVGETFFAHLARRLLCEAPPATPVLSWWGEGFAVFLERQEILASLPYLADVARVEWAVSRARQSADIPPLTASQLAAAASQAMAREEPFHLPLHRSATVIISPWPVYRIWRANQQDDPPPIQLDGGESLMVVRPAQTVEFCPLQPAEASALQTSARGESLEDAAAEALTVSADFDLSALLSRALAAGWLTAPVPPHSHKGETP